MLHRYFAIALFVSIACVPLAHAQTDGHAAFSREARVSIDADGKVTALKFVNWNAKKDLVGEKLEPLIRSWTFEPGRVDGKPAPTETTVTVDLDMRKVDGNNYAITLLDADTGVVWETLKRPDYPKRQLGSSIDAKIVLLVDYDIDGKIDKLAVEDAVSNGSKSDIDEFVVAIDRALKSWRFHPETVGGHAITGVVRVPVEFCMDPGSSQCHALSEQLDGRRGKRGLAPSPKTATALNSQTKLLTQVAGTIL